MGDCGKCGWEAGMPLGNGEQLCHQLMREAKVRDAEVERLKDAYAAQEEEHDTHAAWDTLIAERDELKERLAVAMEAANGHLHDATVLKAKLAEVEKQARHAEENMLGTKQPPLTKSECEALLHAVFTTDTSPVLMAEQELAEVKDHWGRFAKDENKMDAAWLAFNLGPLLDHAQMQAAQIEKAEAACAALRAALEEATESIRHSYWTGHLATRLDAVLAANPAGAGMLAVWKAVDAVERLASKNVEPRKAADIAVDHVQEMGRLLSELYEAVRKKRGSDEFHN